MTRLAPSADISPAALRAGQSHLVRDAAWSSLTGALSGGVVLVAFALYLEAGPMVIGLLSAIPVASQVAQLPGIALIERWRQRKRLAVWLLTASRVMIIGLAALPFIDDRDTAIALLIAAQVGIGIAGSLSAGAVNSWLHQLIAPEQRGPFFARRLLWGTLLAAAGSLIAGQAIERTGVLSGTLLAATYAVTLAAAGVAGLMSSWHLAQAPEPPMAARVHNESLWELLRRPLADANFRRMLRFLGAWAVASNIAAPFLTVYLVRQLGWGIGVVTALAVAGSLANAGALALWGRLSARLAHKSVLRVALPVYFLGMALLVLPAQLDNDIAALALFVLLHVLLGAASGGIALASSNLGLELAPQGQGTSYLAMIGLVGAIGGGLAPVLAGAAGEWFQPRQLQLVMRWQAPLTSSELIVIGFAHWEFLFLLCAASGLYVMHRLSLVQEGREAHGQRDVIQQFAIEAARSVDSLSSIGTALGVLFPFRRWGQRSRDG